MMNERQNMIKSLGTMRTNLHDDMKDYYTSGEIDKAYLSIHRETQKFIEDVVLPILEKIEKESD